jgi:hypothetical protein
MMNFMAPLVLREVCKFTIFKEKTKMKTSHRIFGALLLLASTASVSLANPIEGWLTFTGAATLNSFDASDATVASNWQVMPPTLVSDGGDFASLGNPLPNASFISPWNFTTNSTTNPAAPLNFMSIGSFNFTLENSWIADDSTSGWITVDANGWLTEGANGPTWTNIVITFNSPLDVETIVGSHFSSNTIVEADHFTATVTVPDGGTTAALIGAALLGLTLVSRRRSVRQA